MENYSEDEFEKESMQTTIRSKPDPNSPGKKPDESPLKAILDPNTRK